MQRAQGVEWMDQPDVGRRELVAALDDLGRVNRWLGGWRVLRSCMRRLLHGLPAATYRVLDVATGSADLPLLLERWARRRATPLRIVAVDNHPLTLEIARQRSEASQAISVTRADARALPFPDRAFDFALCSTALHHFDRADALRVLRELGRVASLGVVVNDLRRSRLGFYAASLLGATVWRNTPVTRHDGPLSVRRAFTVGELRALASAAGLERVTVRAHAPFRLSLVVDRSPNRRSR